MSKITSSGDSAPDTSISQPIVFLNNVDVKLLGNKVLHGITWSLFAGDHWAIVGANGSGKTSFLRLVAGNLWPASENGVRRYDFGGDLHTDAVEALSRITIVGHELQDRYVQLGWDFDATEVILSGIYKTDVPRQEPDPQERKRASEILAELDLSHLAHRSFLELSRGEQRRVLLGRALGFNPSILILDEPLAGLDITARKNLNKTIDQVSKKISILCSYHEVSEFPLSLNKILKLKKGHIEYLEELSKTAPVNAEAPAPSIKIEIDRANLNQSITIKPIIDIENANIWLDERQTLTNISWRLLEGEHWQITGSNGAGKTTFLRMLHGQLRPAIGGTINFPGIDNPENIWILRQQIAWVSPELQAGYWYPSTAKQCINSGFDSSIGQTRKLSSQETSRVDELIKQFELGEIAERNVRSLSYGQFRRVLIARALVYRPKVLLLDEPWEGLDPENLKLITKGLDQSISHGTQLVCATHLHRNISHFNRALEMKNGRIVRSGKLN
ncbi:MAG: hypothetical protein CMM56_05680 [Rhodospirillaceae bacterium]|nr:hypothetical protein [Rhodospirillaceae bacterium]|tara:strand:+ start:2782 stop:4287 length:1506 start_codon:yes stop_codon:yes gene_type:complete